MELGTKIVNSFPLKLRCEKLSEGYWLKENDSEKYKGLKALNCLEVYQSLKENNARGLEINAALHFTKYNTYIVRRRR